MLDADGVEFHKPQKRKKNIEAKIPLFSQNKLGDLLFIYGISFGFDAKAWTNMRGVWFWLGIQEWF